MEEMIRTVFREAAGIESTLNMLMHEIKYKAQVHTQSLPRHRLDLPTRSGVGGSEARLYPNGEV